MPDPATGLSDTTAEHRDRSATKKPLDDEIQIRAVQVPEDKYDHEETRPLDDVIRAFNITDTAARALRRGNTEGCVQPVKKTGTKEFYRLERANGNVDHFAILRPASYAVRVLLRPSGRILHVTEGQCETEGLPDPLDEHFDDWDELRTAAEEDPIVPLKS